MKAPPMSVEQVGVLAEMLAEPGCLSVSPKAVSGLLETVRSLVEEVEAWRRAFANTESLEPDDHFGETCIWKAVAMQTRNERVGL